MLFKESTLDNYFNITKINVALYLQDYSNFIDNNSSDISNYYSGDIITPNISSFTLLEELIKRGKEVIESFYLNKKYFQHISDWNLLELIDDFVSKLETLSNIGKYLRSNINKNQFYLGIEKDFNLGAGQTLEKLTDIQIHSSNPDNDWATLALYNDLIEEDYTPKGGIMLKSIINPTSDKVILDSVLGNLQGENLYGKDVYKILTFEDNDLKVLTPKATILQTIKINLELGKGDSPEFPNDGIQKSMFIGNNIGALQFPILFRQLSALFEKDDTISSFSIVDIKYVEDSINMDYEIQTTYGEKFNMGKILN